MKSQTNIYAHRNANKFLSHYTFSTLFAVVQLPYYKYTYSTQKTMANFFRSFFVYLTDYFDGRLFLSYHLQKEINWPPLFYELYVMKRTEFWKIV